MIILTFVPYTGFMSIGIISFTIIPVVIAFATYHQKLAGAILTSILFGLGSFILAMAGITHSILFTRPEIAILPRVILGLLVWAISLLLGTLKFWKFVLLTVCTVLLNTSLVTGFMFMTSLYDAQVRDVAKTLWLWLALIWLNFTFEISVAVILSFGLFFVLKGLLKSLEEQQKNSW